MAHSKTPWADTPFRLVEMPGRCQDADDHHEAIWIAREMAFAHNGMIRSLNSIHQQCILVNTSADIRDLLQFTKMWCDWIEEHHEVEERLLFPRFETLSGSKGLMMENVKQHEAFHTGLEQLRDFAIRTTPEQYDGNKLRAIIDSFGSSLTTHLSDEIESLLGLEAFDGPTMKNAFIEFDEELRKGDPVTSLSVSSLGVFYSPNMIAVYTLSYGHGKQRLQFRKRGLASGPFPCEIPGPFLVREEIQRGLEIPAINDLG